MSNFKNLKIEISDQAPILAVCEALERIGYVKCKSFGSGTITHIFAFDDGEMIGSFQDHDIPNMCEVTLKDLLNEEPKADTEG